MKQNKNWDATRIPDQKGRVIIVTGSTSGIGKEAARVLITKNATVVLAVRNAKKGKTIIEEFKEKYPEANVSTRKLDLADLGSVKIFAESFTKDFDRLDVLINNAGIMMCPYSKTADGFEIQFGTNHLGHFALTVRLPPLLRETKDSRIVNVSSGAHRMGNPDFSDLNWEERKYNTQRAYSDSKISNLYFTYELARRLEKEGNNPKVAAAHPGWTATELQRHSRLFGFLNNFFAQGVDMGALPTLRAGFHNEAKPGDFFEPKGFFHMRGYPVKEQPSDRSHDAEAAKKLWKLSEEMTGVKYKGM